MNKKIKIHILIFILGIICYLVLDYLNIPTLLNIQINNINNDLLSIFINSVIVIFLIINNILEIPFETKNIILDFAKNGEINVKTLQNFLIIESDYRKYINMLW